MLMRCLALSAVLLITLPAAAQDAESPKFEPTLSTFDTPYPSTSIRQVSLNESARPEAMASEAANTGALAGDLQQIVVSMQLLELNLTKLRKLDVDIAYAPDGGSNGDGGKLAADARANGLARRFASDDGPMYDFELVKDGRAFSAFLKWLQKNEIAIVLANPNLAIICGRPASFNDGGDFPVPSAPGSNSAVEFRKYGTSVNLLAQALDKEHVRIKVDFEVSELDDAHSLTISGMRVPAIKKREIQSTYEIPYGQTAVIAGMNQERVESLVKDGQLKEQRIEIRTLLTITPERVPPRAQD
jgi:Flp pilus assembly secretin CpaC